MLVINNTMYFHYTNLFRFVKKIIDRILNIERGQKI